MSGPRTGPVVLLAGHGDSTWIVANSLLGRGYLASVVLESHLPKLPMLRRRAKRLGWRTAAGQLAFLPVAHLMRERSASRIEDICTGAGLVRQPPADIDIVPVESVNDDTTVETLRRLRPAVVVVNGTRIITREVLDVVPAAFVNLHAGITPAYRGVHGGYWALARGDSANCGVTVHLVDPGIDTGSVLAQARVHPSGRDNFATYPYLQLAAGVPLLVDSIERLLAGTATPSLVDLPSRLWSHPTLCGYLLTRTRRGVR